MARYTGPVCRLCRRTGEKLLLKGERCEGPKCSIEKRASPPGQRPTRRRKVSDCELRLREKQKARFTYGVMEKQFYGIFAMAQKNPGTSGDTYLCGNNGILTNGNVMTYLNQVVDLGSLPYPGHT